MPLPLADRRKHSLTAGFDACSLPGGTCGGSAPSPFSSYSIAVRQQAAVDSAGGCSSHRPARAFTPKPLQEDT